MDEKLLNLYAEWWKGDYNNNAELCKKDLKQKYDKWKLTHKQVNDKVFYESLMIPMQYEFAYDPYNEKLYSMSYAKKNVSELAYEMDEEDLDIYSIENYGVFYPIMEDKYSLIYLPQNFALYKTMAFWFYGNNEMFKKELNELLTKYEKEVLCDEKL